MRWKAFAAAIAVNAVVLATLLLVFDGVSYFALPESIAVKFDYYRKGPYPDVPGRGQNIYKYWTAHGERGFDIGENRHAVHWVDGKTIEVWSNSLGCFDLEHSALREDFTYLAGDSFTWGYSPFDMKFGSILERETGIQMLKCGVSHTGQRHQLAKMVEIVNRLDRAPKKVLVFFFANDLLNDFLHPHSTVISDFLMNTVYLDADENIVTPSIETIKARLNRRLSQQTEAQREKSFAKYVKQKLKRYSVTANILNALVDQFLDASEDAQTDGDSSTPDVSLRSFYGLPYERDSRVWYTDNPIADDNKKAILAFKRFSDQVGAQLTLVLIPPQHKYADMDWHSEVRLFLAENAINYIDLAGHFAERDYAAKDLYLAGDGHFNADGNRVVAMILVAELFDDASDSE